MHDVYIHERVTVHSINEYVLILSILCLMKKEATKDHIFYESIFMKYPEIANLWRQEKISGGGVREDRVCRTQEDFGW